MAFQAGTAFVQVLPSLKGFHTAIKRELATIKDVTIDVTPRIDTKAVKAELATIKDIKLKVTPEVDDALAKGKIAALGAKSSSIKIPVSVDDKGVAPAVAGVNAKLATIKDKRVKVDIDKRPLDEATNSIAMLSRSLTQLAMPIGAALIAPALIQIAGSAAVASQSLLLLPAIGAAGGVAFATLKIGATGFGDAMKHLGKGDLDKFNADIAKMAPEARDLALEVQKLGPAWTSVRMDVQNALFKDLSGHLATAAQVYLPILRTGLAGTAVEFNGLATEAFAFFRDASRIADVATIIDNTRLSVAELNPAVGAILSIFMDLAAVGSDFLPNLAGGFAECATTVADFVSKARATGDLHRWISDGLDAIGQLLLIIINAGKILHGIYTSVNSDGLGFLKTIKNLSIVTAEWVNSVQGQSALGEFFGNLKLVAMALLPVLGGIALAVVQMVNTIAPALPGLIKGLLDVWMASGSLLGVFGELAVSILPALGAALSFLAPILGPMVALWVAVNAAMKIYAVTVGIVRAATAAWAVVQAVLNGTLLLNPIGLVVVALVALAAALVFAWHHSETFRDIVTGAWDRIKTFVAVTWASLQTIFAAIGVAVTAVGNFFTWLWTSVIQPVFSFISVAARVLFAIVVTAVLLPLYLFIVNVLGPIFTWLWNDIIRPAWAGIQAVISAAWNFIRDNIFNPVVAFLAGVFTAAWNNLKTNITIVWNAIQSVISTVWNWLLANVFNPVVNFLKAVFGPAFTWFQGEVSRTWNAIQAVISTVWNFVRDNIFNPMMNFITVSIPNAFQRGVDAIGALWTKIKQVMRDPIQAVIDVVYNRGIVPLWNGIASLVGLGPIGTFSLPQYATGGVITGGSGVRDDVPILATGGEYIFDKKTVRNMGGVDQVAALHMAFKGDRSPLNLDPMYMMYGGDESSPGLAFGFAGGGSIDAALAFARAQNGKPYQWGGVGNPSYDCSGFQSAITNVLTGRPPNSRLFSTGSFANGPVAGFQRGTGSAYVIGVRQGNPGHMAGNLAGVPVESNGSGVTVGRGASPMSFPAQFFLPQVGGQFVNAGGAGGAPAPPPEFLAFPGKILDILRSIGGLATGSPWAQAAVNMIKNIVTKISDMFTAKISAYADATIGGAAAAGPGNAAFGPALDTGGVITGTGMFGKWTSAPERILSDQQNRSFEQLVATLDRGGYRGSSSRVHGAHDGMRESAGRDSAAPLVGTLIAQVPAGANAGDVVDAALFKLRHTRRGLHQ